MVTSNGQITSYAAWEWVRRAQEAVWLLLVFVVPLAFLSRSDILSSPVIVFIEVPKIAILRTLAGLLGALWLAEWALESKQPAGIGYGARRGWDSLRRWFRPSGPTDPIGWVRLAVTFYFGTVLLSTVLSASLPVSLWGEVPGQDGYGAYTTAAYAMVFAVVATHLKTQDQQWRLMVAIAASGVLVGGYAVSQHFGGDFFRLLGPVQHGIATSTMGNAIFVGSVLLITLTVSLAAAASHFRNRPGAPGPRRAWWVWTLWIAVLAVQMLGIIYTSSRGPWVGTVFALGLFVGLAFLFSGWRTGVRGVLVLAAAAAITAAVLIFPGHSFGDSFGPGSESSGGPSQAARAAERFTSIGGQVTSGGFSGRRDIWLTSWRLMQNRPWVDFDQMRLSFLRPVVGYGPDLHRTVYLLDSRPRGELLLPGEAHQAHNFFLHAGVELGFLGLLASLGIFGVPLLAGGYLLLWRTRSYSFNQRVILIMLLAVIAGRLLEQMVGLARVSDLTMFWALLAVMAAMPGVVAPQSAGDGVANGKENPVSNSGIPAGEFAAPGAWRLLILLIVVAGIAGLTWTKSIDYPRAALSAGEINGLIGQGDFAGGLAASDKAISLAPDVFVYHNHRAAVLDAAQAAGDPLLAVECAHRSNIPYQGCLGQEIYKSNRQGVFQRPLHYRARVARPGPHCPWQN
ncbi:MAG: hypothetical protein BZY88_00080 [SAR202 cluster bacterium Io17-Chloro-G9]|nr:MAG: hypothetical protein BZY88_00080 [SAR202 cluster bacterium Io17-Chloro-G9]